MIRKWLVSGAMVVVAAPAWAEGGKEVPAGSPTALSETDQEKARRSDGTEIVVTGQRTIPGGQVAKDSRIGILGDSDTYSTPFSTKAYTAELIRDQGARNINDVVANDPSIRVSLSPTFVLDQSSIRGFLVVGGNYLFDGLPSLTPNYGTMPVAHLDRVDIFKGPASALTAAIGSVGGVINLAPKRAIDTPITSVTLSAQTGALLGGHVDVGRRFGPDGMLGVRVNVSGETGELYDGSSRDQLASTVALDFRSGPVRGVIDAGYIEYETRGQGINYTLAPGAQLPPVPNPRRGITPHWAFFNDRTWFALGKLELDFADGWTAYVRYGENIQRMDSVVFGTGPLDSSGGFAVTSFTVYRPWNNRETVAEVGLRGTFATGPIEHNLVVTGLRLTGGNSEFGVVDPSVGALPRGSIYQPYPFADPFAAGLPPRNIVPAIQPRLDSVAIADDLSLLDDRLRVILGARRQRIEQQPYDQTKTTPTFAVLFKATPALSLYGNYAEALTQGVIAPPNVTNPGEQLPPYVSRQHEFGAKWNAGRFGLMLAYFDIRQDFAIINAVNTFVLGGEQRNRGVELETFGEPLPGLRLLGGAAWIDGEQTRTATGATTGNKALGVPEWTANLGVEHDLAALPGLTVTGRYTYTDKSFVDLANTQIVPSWDRFDVTARYRVELPTAVLTARAGVSNLFDDRYWATGGRNIISVAAPRTWFASLSADF